MSIAQYRSRPASVARLLTELRSGRSTGLMVTGDSTGAWTAARAGKTPWTSYFARMVAESVPSHAVQIVNWNNGSGGAVLGTWDQPVVVSGTPSGRYAHMSGASTLAHPGDGTAFSADLDVLIKVAFPTWPPPASATLCSRWGNSSGTCSWLWNVSSGGNFSFFYSSDGSTTQVSAGACTVSGYSANTPRWFRYQRTASTGAWTFQQSTDNGVTWTQIQAGTATSGTIFDPGNAMPFEVSGWNHFNSGVVVDVYEIEVRPGINGVSVVPRYLDNWAGSGVLPAASFFGQPVFTLLNGSIPGADIEYLIGSSLGTGGSFPTRLPAMTTPAWCSAAHLLNCSHNDSFRHGAPYLASWDSWLSSLRSRSANREVLINTQNPKAYPANYVEAHATRRRDLLSWAAKNNLQSVDVYRAFDEAPFTLNQLVSQNDASPGVHETDDIGAPYWAGVVFDALLGELASI